MPLLETALAAGSALASTGINAVTQGNLNKKTRKWNEQQNTIAYERDQANWHMQNAYNSPQEQMRRLQAAGLNPNLVYGNGSAVNTASSPSSAPVPSWNPRSPEVDLGTAARSGIDTYFNVATREAQLDNLKAQNTVLLEEALLKKASTRATLANAGLSEFDLGYKTEMRPVSAEFQREGLRGAQLRNTNLAVQNFYQSALQQRTLDNLDADVFLKEAQMHNLNVDRTRIQETIKSIRADTKLKELEADLQKNGVSKNDPIYFRVLGRYLSENYGNLLK